MNGAHAASATRRGADSVSQHSSLSNEFIKVQLFPGDVWAGDKEEAGRRGRANGVGIGVG